MKPERDEKGRLLPGNTANPKGRPKRKTFREYFTEEEEQDLINKLKTSDKPEIWMKMAEHLFGKPRQNIGLDGGEDGKPIAFEDLTDEQLDDRIKRLQASVIGVTGSEEAED